MGSSSTYLMGRANPNRLARARTLTHAVGQTDRPSQFGGHLRAPDGSNGRRALDDDDDEIAPPRETLSLHAAGVSELCCFGGNMCVSVFGPTHASLALD